MRDDPRDSNQMEQKMEPTCSNPNVALKKKKESARAAPNKLGRQRHLGEHVEFVREKKLDNVFR